LNRQVKRHRDKRRKRRDVRAQAARNAATQTEELEVFAQPSLGAAVSGMPSLG